MKLNARERALTVAMAEAACLQAHIARIDATKRLQGELLRVATPLRIVGTGFATGLFAGFRPLRPKATGGGPLGALLSMAMETVLPSIMAGLTAGQVAGDEVEAATDEVADDVAERVADRVTPPGAR